MAKLPSRVQLQVDLRSRWLTCPISAIVSALSAGSLFLKKNSVALDHGRHQSESDAERIESLGVERAKLFTAGNLKFDVGTVARSGRRTKELQQRFGILEHVALILWQVLTHPKKIFAHFEAFQQLRQNQKVRLMIAPRRPEMFNEVARLLDDSGLRWVRRTSPQQVTDSDARSSCSTL